ncbi:MAG: hypothetical protein LKM38_14580 [Pseudomonas veronii]|jgi:hypothetical protein|nr:hypothetical protein [Pseudomonas veronii]
MQETQYEIRLAEEDKRWMTFAALSNEATLNSVLTPLPDSFVGPSSLDAEPQPSSELGLALVTVSLDINALTLEQVRLRETLETLNSTLFITSDSLALRTVETVSQAQNSQAKEPPPAADSWVDKSLQFGADAAKTIAKDVGSSLWDTAKSRVSGKAIDALAQKFPKAGKWLKDDKDKGTDKDNDKDCCCRGESLRGAVTPSIILPPGYERSGGKKTSAKKTAKSTRWRELPVPRGLGPLKYADTAINVIQGIRDGDAKAVTTGLSTAGGAWAGASAGAAIGTLVLPGIGTAVGGAIGGLLGSEAGAWLGDKLFSPADRLPAPNAVSKELNSACTDNVQVTLAPSIQITGVNPADAQQVVNQVIQALQFQCLPMLSDTLGVRRNAALADPGGD